MSNETKRDVFNDLLEELADANIALDGEGIGYELTNEDKQVYMKDYDTALPDDMPVIPETIGKYIKYCKGDSGVQSLMYAMDFADDPNDDWLHDMPANQNTFATAWVLGVWRVEETGEIVKLEAEK